MKTLYPTAPHELDDLLWYNARVGVGSLLNHQSWPSDPAHVMYAHLQGQVAEALLPGTTSTRDRRQGTHAALAVHRHGGRMKELVVNTWDQMDRRLSACAGIYGEAGELQWRAESRWMDRARAHGHMQMLQGRGDGFLHDTLCIQLGWRAAGAEVST